MYSFHADKERYFDIQYRVTKEHILPFLKEHAGDKKWHRVLEIGCAEAGVLKAFLEEGAFCTGIELSAARIGSAEKYHAEALREERIEFINRNIYDIDPVNDLGGKYDLVILKDVIEHIPGQKEFIRHLKSFLNIDGYVFFGFPPWQMPFGGHQQIAKSKVLSLLPWYHLLPAFAYKRILKLFGESEGTIEALMEIKDTGISIERFEQALAFNNFTIVARKHFLVNPIYSYKFKLKPRAQSRFVSSIPFVRNFFTSASYYLVKPKAY
jgi:2-polyprenyl-3-methyl-5-hydroxy-6-metoxy-1,4-benzoquinol methylase